jgi:16S rRNA (cytosine967-C5)-methyltransferase
MTNVGRKPKPDPARTLVFDLLTQVNREGAYANLRLPELLEQSTLSERDRAFATELGYGTLRMQGKHDALIESTSDRPFAELDPGVVDVLRMGIHQIFEMRVPDHAAVGETVEVARAKLGESKASFVNALLRKSAGNQGFYQQFESFDLADENLVRNLSITYSHPEWEVKAFYDALRDWSEVRAQLQANNVPAVPQLIAWPGKSTVEELISEGGSRIGGTDFGVLSEKMPGKYLAIKERRAGVQDKGSQIIASIFLNTATSQNQLSWLDMCAGPGGKAAALFWHLHEHRPGDQFTANEPLAHRAALVGQVIPSEFVIQHPGEDLASLGVRYDRILVDAPCTGLGALRRRPEARWRRTQSDLKELIAIQKNLLNATAELINENGIIAYVTCSPHLGETQGQILEFQRKHPEFQKLNISQYLPEGNEDMVPNDDGTLQMWTHRHSTDSMFMTLLQRAPAQP